MKFTLPLRSDPRGSQVMMPWRGRTLLGDVTEAYRDETRGMVHLRVRHFNGEPWPLEPHIFAVDVLERAP